jgi:hypothetical protein
VSDAIVLSVGPAAGGTLDGAVAAARGAVELIRLRPAAPEGHVRRIDGALTGQTLRQNPPRAGEVLVAEDFASIFLSPAERRTLGEAGVRLAVRRPARLLALTSNPTAPARPPVPAAKLVAALAREFADVPIFDLVADLQSAAA